MSSFQSSKSSENVLHLYKKLFLTFFAVSTYLYVLQYTVRNYLKIRPKRKPTIFEKNFKISFCAFYNSLKLFLSVISALKILFICFYIVNWLQLRRIFNAELTDKNNFREFLKVKKEILKFFPEKWPKLVSERIKTYQDLSEAILATIV